MANKKIPDELLGVQIQIRIRPHYAEFVKSINFSKFVEECIARKFRQELLDNTSVEYYRLAGEYGITMPELSEPDNDGLKLLAEYDQS